jgi:AbrB family looped-hinge helix DNA binding protein
LHYLGNEKYDPLMASHQSKITSQGQVTVPVEVRKRLGLAPGSVIEWREVGGQTVVVRAAKYASGEIHEALFPEAPVPKSLEELDEGLRQRAHRKHARD